MDHFKLKPGLEPSYQITKVNFETQTLKQKPYVQRQTNRVSYYAVCPECDNLIQIVGLQRDTIEGGRKPYGRHNKHSIEDLAVYSEIDYLDCPFSNPSWETPTGKKSPSSPLASKMLVTMQTQFDTVISALRAKTGLAISHNMARKLLETYMLDEGWLYRHATLNNLPWILGESSLALPLFGQFIQDKSELAQAIREKCPQVILEPSAFDQRLVQVRNKPGEFVRLSFIFCNHHQQIINDSLQETIDFLVFKDSHLENDGTVLRRTIPILENEFTNRIKKQKGGQRDTRLLALAQAVIGKYVG